MLLTPSAPIWRHLGIYTWYLLIFLQPFSRFGGLRLVCTALLLIALLAEFRSQWRQLSTSSTGPKIALLLVAWIIATSLLGPYPVDSLHSLRTDLLVQSLMFTAGLLYIRSPADAWRPIVAAILGFGLVTALSFVEITPYLMETGLSERIPRDHTAYWGGYSSTGSLFIPLLLGWLLAVPRKSWQALLGWTLMAAAALLVFLYGSRTPLVAIMIAALAMLILLRRWRSLLLAFSISAAAVVTLQVASLGYLQSYRSLLNENTYLTNTGLSQRHSVWEGSRQIIAERPWTGYGYGWKKLAWAINDSGIGAEWEAMRPDIAAYFLVDGFASYGKVNPHNYVLQVTFEIGCIGLALVFLFWVAVIRDGSFLLRAKNMQLRNFAAAFFAVSIAYALANITNGYWVGGLANIMLTYTGCLLALARVARNNAKADAP